MREINLCEEKGEEKITKKKDLGCGSVQREGNYGDWGQWLSGRDLWER